MSDNKFKIKNNWYRFGIDKDNKIIYLYEYTRKNVKSGVVVYDTIYDNAELNNIDKLVCEIVHEIIFNNQDTQGYFEIFEHDYILERELARAIKLYTIL